MTISGQADATGMTTAQAAEAFEAMLTRDEEAGQSDAETLQGDEPEPEAEEEAPPEGEAETEAEEESEPEEPEAEEEQQPDTHVVKIDGVEIPVTLDELKNGYQRDADYRRKTAQVAEERRALEPEKQALAAERKRVADQLDTLSKLLEQPLYPQEEMDWLRANNPGEFAARMVEIQNRHNDKLAVAAEQQRLDGLARQQQAETAQRTRQEELERLYGVKPEWKDPAKLGVALDQMRGALVKVGFPAAELDSVTDHRLVLLLEKAAKFDALSAKAPVAKAKAEAVKTAKPGVAAQQRAPVTEITRAKQRLAKTGRVEDAAALFLQRLG